MDILLQDNLGYDVWEVEDIPNNTISSIWILGKSYKYEELERIRDMVMSILWCTYRKAFPPLGSSQYTSDKGFGCMLRCGQMLLAEALKRVHLGSFTWSRDTKDKIYLSIVNRFEDNKNAPYGIHQIGTMGQDSGKNIGEWFSPNVIAQVLKKLVRLDESSNLVVHVALDHQVATEEILELQDTSEWKPILIIIPLRLGLNEVNPIYIDGLKKCLELKETLGIIGGRPNQALYFIGYVGDDILYLDPHTCQRSGTVGNKENQTEIEFDETYHQRFAGRMTFSSMDPSIAVSFICKTRHDFNNLIEQLSKKDDKTPLFEVIQSRAIPWTASSSMASSRDLEQDLTEICGGQSHDDFEEVRKEEGSEDEFEIIE
ncbi:CLUMA_CG006328, isoform A [Clunio marinus]|uniref:Cysteine protease n=1 Tax=Clunio marinus TaxID=568069 RepID=A0A1J1HZ23_9DIPT|nr:CLUMA_CG006328, isoform A [Clunio marinus]